MMSQDHQLLNHDLLAKLVDVIISENNKIKKEINYSIKIETNKILKIVEDRNETNK